MPNLIMIGDQEIDFDDPCAVCTALKMVELAVAAGGSVKLTQFGQDRVEFSPANVANLKKLIDQYANECAKKSGKRTRFAAGVKWSR